MIRWALCIFAIVGQFAFAAEEKNTMQITSPSFNTNEMIPVQFTCQGANISPALTFANVPANTVSFAILVDDPDAPLGIFNHWVAWNIPGRVREFKEGETPPRNGRNDFAALGYRGPCPPRGAKHRYFFKVYALDTTLRLESGSVKSQLEAAMEGHILAEGELIGLYQRS